MGRHLTGETRKKYTITKRGDEANVGIKFTIARGKTGPQGAQGQTGAKGKTGPQGPTGPGVAAGGKTGQVLAKKSNTNYDTEWINPETCGPISGNGDETGTGQHGAQE